MPARRSGCALPGRSDAWNRCRRERGYLPAHRQARRGWEGGALSQLRTARAAALLRPDHGPERRPRDGDARFSGSDAGEDHGVCIVRSVLGLAGVIVLAIVFSPTAADGSRIFLQTGNLTDILRQISVIGIIALAMTYVILTAGIDLSVGSILALSTTVAAMTLTRAGQGTGSARPILLAILAALAISTTTGALNGAVIALLGIQPFVVTLASMIGIRGLAKWLSGNANIDIGFGQDVAAQFAAAFRQKVVVIGSYLALTGVFWLVLAKTVFGRHVRA